MIMEIFGAGASYDSIPSRPPALWNRVNLPSRPPLASELFRDRDLFAEALSRFPDCHPIVPYLQGKGTNIETTLERLQTESEMDPVRKRQLASVRFYLHFVMWECERLWKNVGRGITNHFTLLDQLRRIRRNAEPILLVTFNYDRMIEDALPSIGILIQDLPQYIAHDSFKVFKLHGSAHWGREVEAPDVDLTGTTWQVGQQLIQRAEDLKLSTRFRMVNEYPIGKADGVALFPAIAIPTETKRSYECPDEHLACLKEFLPQVTKVLTVGWSGSEQHFLMLLKECLANEVRWYTVTSGKETAEEVIARIKQVGIRMNAEAFGGGFSDFVVSRIAEQFLRE